MKANHHFGQFNSTEKKIHKWSSAKQCIFKIQLTQAGWASYTGHKKKSFDKNPLLFTHVYIHNVNLLWSKF